MKDSELSLGSGAAWNAAGSLIYSAANWLTTVLVVVLGDGLELSGNLAIAMAIGNLTATIALFNLRPIQVSDVEDSFSSSQFISFRVVTSVAAGLISVAYALFTVAPYCLEVVIAYVAFKISDSFVDVFHGIDQCHNRLDIVGKSQMIRGVLVVVTFSMAIELTNSLVLAIWLMCFATIAVVLIFDYRKSLSLEGFGLDFGTGSLRSLFVICAPGLISMLLCTYVVTYARQYYGALCGSYYLGIYAAIATPTVVIQLLAGYLYYPLLGLIAEFWKHKQYRKLLQITARFFLCLSILVVLCVAFFVLFGELVFSAIFGAEVGQYYEISYLVVVCVGMTAAAIFMIDILVVFRMQKSAVAASLASVVSCVAASSTFMELFGMNGISISVAFSYLVCCFCSLVVVFHSVRKRKGWS